jgi:hypothetical protein
MRGAEGRAEILAPEEIRSAINTLPVGEKATLVKIARFYARRTPYEYEDLIHEAYCRVLDSERRTWRRGVPALLFLAGVVRSIASEWKSEILNEEVGVGDVGASARGVMAKMDAVKIVALFDDDPVAQALVVGMMEGARGEELEQSSGLNRTEYESKRKKIRRRIEKLDL